MLTYPITEETYPAAMETVLKQMDTLTMIDDEFQKLVSEIADYEEKWRLKIAAEFRQKMKHGRIAE